MNSSNPDDPGVPSPAEDPIFLNARLEVPPELEPETEQLLPIVVGAHVRGCSSKLKGIPKGAATQSSSRGGVICQRQRSCIIKLWGGWPLE